MTTIDLAGLSIVAALVFIVAQQLGLRKLERDNEQMHNTIVGIAKGDLETKVDNDEIFIRRTR
jgi:hypothetical protein